MAPSSLTSTHFRTKLQTRHMQPCHIQRRLDKSLPKEQTKARINSYIIPIPRLRTFSFSLLVCGFTVFTIQSFFYFSIRTQCFSHIFTTMMDLDLYFLRLIQMTVQSHLWELFFPMGGMRVIYFGCSFLSEPLMDGIARQQEEWRGRVFLYSVSFILALCFATQHSLRMNTN